MENLNITAENGYNSIELKPEAVKHLDEARKWSTFLAVLGFIGLGFLLLGAIFIGAIFSFIDNETIPGGLGVVISLLYLVLGAVYFFPVYYLLQFSNRSKNAIRESNSGILTEAIGFLKSHYKFVGIMSIVMMVVYPVLMIVLVMVGVFSSM